MYVNTCCGNNNNNNNKSIEIGRKSFSDLIWFPLGIAQMHASF